MLARNSEAFKDTAATMYQLSAEEKIRSSARPGSVMSMTRRPLFSKVRRKGLNKGVSKESNKPLNS